MADMTLRQRVARRLRFLADRIDLAGALRPAGMSFTFEGREGVRVNFDRVGCPLWILGEADFERAWDEALTSQEIRHG